MNWYFDINLGGPMLSLIKTQLRGYLAVCEIVWADAKTETFEAAYAKYGYHLRHPGYLKGLTFSDKLEIFQFLVDTFMEINDKKTVEWKKIIAKKRK